MKIKKPLELKDNFIEIDCELHSITIHYGKDWSH